MLWALNADGQRIEPSKGSRAVCPGCSGEVRAHCGRILIDHWHHEAGDCDPWSEPETQWHRDWKECYDDTLREIWKSPHRADVMLESGTVIEFQHSQISADGIVARERFWKDLIWVFDASEWFHRLQLRDRGEGKFTFRWKHPRLSLAYAEKRRFLDTGEELFQMTFMGSETPCGGSGKFVSYEEFARRCDYWGRVGALS